MTPKKPSVRITLPETRDRIHSSLLVGHEHACVYPLIANPQWNQTPSPFSSLVDTLIDQKPPADMKPGSWHACLKGSLSTSQTMINQYTRTLLWDRFVPMRVVRFTISILFRIAIAPNSVHCSSSVLSLCSPRASDRYAVMACSIESCLWFGKIGWPCEILLVCSWNILSYSLIRLLTLWAENRNRYFLICEYLAQSLKT